MDDGQPEAGAFAPLVEANAAFEHTRPLGGRYSRAIILDEDRCCGIDADADTLRGVARGILK